MCTLGKFSFLVLMFSLFFYKFSLFEMIEMEIVSCKQFCLASNYALNKTTFYVELSLE